MKAAATVALRSLPRAALALPPAWRRRVALAFVVLAALAALYYGWFRNSSFVQVEKVEVSGLAGPQARSIRTALVDAGLGMTTLHVREGDLRAAVSEFPVVRSVTASGDFPHRLRVQVELNLPVALLQTASGRVPVTADGLLLPDVPLTGRLPTLTADGVAPTDRVETGRAADLLRVVALAPGPLRPRIRSVGYRRANGLVAFMRRGPMLIFGDAQRLAVKWMAATRVLASPAARGATYIDVRLPDRPAAGGLPTTSLLPLAPAGPDSATPAAPAVTPTTTTAPTTTTTTTTTAAPTQATSTTPSSAPTAGSQPPTQQTSAPATGAQQAPP
jgi:cell division protein FtsQ